MNTERDKGTERPALAGTWLAWHKTTGIDDIYGVLQRPQGDDLGRDTRFWTVMLGKEVITPGERSNYLNRMAVNVFHRWTPQIFIHQAGDRLVTGKLCYRSEPFRLIIFQVNQFDLGNSG